MLKIITIDYIGIKHTPNNFYKETFCIIFYLIAFSTLGASPFALCNSKKTVH